MSDAEKDRVSVTIKTNDGKLWELSVKSKDGSALTPEERLKIRADIEEELASLDRAARALDLGSTE